MRRFSRFVVWSRAVNVEECLQEFAETFEAIIGKDIIRTWAGRSCRCRVTGVVRAELDPEKEPGGGMAR
jgi:hypothetical protein